MSASRTEGGAGSGERQKHYTELTHEERLERWARKKTESDTADAKDRKAFETYWRRRGGDKRKEIAAKLVKLGLSPPQARRIMLAISRGSIPHVEVDY